MERKAQAAIDRFFKQTQIIPSPWNTKPKENESLDIPNGLSNDLNSTQELSRSTKDAWTQTVLSLPLNLPPNVEEALKPFFTFIQEQNVDNDDANSSNNSLRRKLFFCHDEGTDNEDESFTSLSPVKINRSTTLLCSPPRSGIFHGTPLKKLLQTRRSNESSIVISENLSPPNMSPIHDTENDRLYERIEYYSLNTRLDLTIDMSTNDIAEEKDQSLVNGHYSLDMPNSENDAKNTGNGKLLIINNDKTNVSDSISMEELPKCMNSTDNIMHSDADIFSDKEHNNEMSSKIPLETASFSRESHKQSNIMSGAFEQPSISSSAQDTGYQTYSMNSIMHTLDSYNTSMNNKTLWNEKIMSKDNGQLSWRENIKNVFSSTPSKYNKESGT